MSFCNKLFYLHNIAKPSTVPGSFNGIRMNLHSCTSRSKLGILNVHGSPSSKRTFFKLFRKQNEKELKLKDRIPDPYRLIYRNTMTGYILMTNIVSFVAASGVCLVALWNQEYNTYKLDTKEWPIQARRTDNELIVYVTTFISICVLVQAFVRILPLRIYNQPGKKKYIFVFYGSLPLTTRRLTCLANDVTKLKDGSTTLWRDCRYKISEKQKVIMLEHYFRKPADLNIMLGYQEPPEDYS